MPIPLRTILVWLCICLVLFTGGVCTATSGNDSQISPEYQPNLTAPALSGQDPSQDKSGETSVPPPNATFSSSGGMVYDTSGIPVIPGGFHPALNGGIPSPDTSSEFLHENASISAEGGQPMPDSSPVEAGIPGGLTSVSDARASGSDPGITPSPVEGSISLLSDGTEISTSGPVPPGFTGSGIISPAQEEITDGGPGSSGELNLTGAGDASIASDEYEYYGTLGWYGSGNGQFIWPQDTAFDSQRNIYVVDWGNSRIQKFSPDGQFLMKWGSFGSKDGEFNKPCGIAIDGQDNVYITDNGNSRIQKFRSDGKFLAKWGSIGTKPGQFNEPIGIAVDPRGFLLVADRLNHRVQIFNLNGRLLAIWGSFGTKAGQFDKPNGIAIDKQGNVYVSEAGNCRIQKFNSAGRFLAKWGTKGIKDGEFYWPGHLTFDLSGDLLVPDVWNHRIQKFTSNGEFISKWGTFGYGPGQFYAVDGVAVSSAGILYVADERNDRVQMFIQKGEDYPKISAITPSSASNTGQSGTISLTGSFFSPGATVTLTRTGYPDITATKVTASSAQITCTFPITGAAGGVWNVTVTNPDSRKGVLINGFTITTSTGSPTSPVLAGSLVYGPDAVLQHPWNIKIVGNYAYVTSPYSSTLEILDVSNPIKPVHKGSIKDGDGGAFMPYAHIAQVSGKYAYVITRFTLSGPKDPNYLEIVDVSNPEKPSHKGGIVDKTGGAYLNYTLDLFVAGNYAYVSNAGYDPGLEIIDISNPGSPAHISTYRNEEGGVPDSIYVAGNYAYVGYWNDIFEIVDISDPVHPVQKGCIRTGEGGIDLEGIQKIFISGNYAYFLGGFNHEQDSMILYIADISNPAKPVIKGCLRDGEGGAKLCSRIEGLLVRGTSAFLTSFNDEALEIVDVSNPEKPVHKGSIVGGTGGAVLEYPIGIDISGRYAYICTTLTNLIEIFDVGAPSPAITRISPTTVLKISPTANLGIEGSDFQSGAGVTLTRTGYPAISATSVAVASPTKITCTLPISTAVAGVWDVAVKNPDSQTATLTNALTIIQPPSPPQPTGSLK